MNRRITIESVVVAGVLLIFCLVRPSFHLETDAQVVEKRLSREIHGLDVSHYQGHIDWDVVPTASYDYVLIKATGGTAYVDPRLRENAAGAKAKNLPHGFYHFYDPQLDPYLQARHFINAVRAFGAPLRPVLDVEIIQTQSTRAIREGVLIWLKTVEKAFGCKPLLYTDRVFWDDHLSAGFKRYGLWLADYTEFLTLPKKRPQWLLWQYSDTGRVSGIPSIVDLNQMNPAREMGELYCHG